ncbi:MAG: hypothetical protein JWO22_184, partial [Frankiales bacterium]|nr:hypothetical protein [Frankiales bacterium]
MTRRPRSLQLTAGMVLVLALTACGAHQDVVNAFDQSGSPAAAAAGSTTGLTGGGTGGPGSPASTGTTGAGTSGGVGQSATSGGGTTGGTGSGSTSGTPVTNVGGSGSGSTSTTGSGQVAGNRTGITNTEIRLGFHVPKHVSGVDFDHVAKTSELLTVYWKYVNDKGINGRKVSI